MAYNSKFAKYKENKEQYIFWCYRCKMDVKPRFNYSNDIICEICHNRISEWAISKSK